MTKIRQKLITAAGKHKNSKNWLKTEYFYRSSKGFSFFNWISIHTMLSKKKLKIDMCLLTPN